jgi:ceramide synthetase
MLLHVLVRRVTHPLAKVAVVRKSKWSDTEYEAKLDRFGSAVFKAIFFSGFTGYFYFVVLREAAWLPPALFGSGSIGACWGPGNAGAMQEPPSAAFEWSFQIAMAYHISELASQVLFEWSKPDFVEMMVHHSTTCFLILSSLCMNYVRIGSLVLFLHYISDIPVYFTKIFVDTPLKLVTVTCYLSCLVSWAYLRLYVFPHYVIHSVIYDGAGEIPLIGQESWAGFVFGLSLLLCLHMYWYGLFLKIGWALLRTGKTVDMQANIGTKTE